jgi:hypothetical protein
MMPASNKGDDMAIVIEYPAKKKATTPSSLDDWTAEDWAFCDEIEERELAKQGLRRIE